MDFSLDDDQRWRAWVNFEAADLMVWKAAALYDAGQPCGTEANAAKYLAAEAAHDPRPGQHRRPGQAGSAVFLG